MARIFFVFVFILINVGISAQTSKRAEDLLEEAKKQLSVKNYVGTIKICKQIITSEPKSKDAHLLMADAYSNLDSINAEILHLNKAGEIGREWDVVFRLGEAYYKKGDYSEALRYYNIYSDYKYISEKRQFLLACKMASCRYAIYSVNNPEEIKPRIKANQAPETYWPTTSDDGKNLVFTRISKNPEQGQQEDFYMAGLDSLKWDIVKTQNSANEIDNEGVEILSDSMKIMFFTACDRPDGLGNCDIYFIKFENGKWSEPVNAGRPLNSEAWEAYPAFSNDNRFLYFSSNRTGGIGKKDIWKAELLGFFENGLPKWKDPVNLGSPINTAGDEVSPFIHFKKQNIYFVSDSHAGLGGMDVFKAETDDAGNIKNLKNLEYPINTNNDEIGLTLSSIGGTSFFSCFRNAEKGLEIFAFNLDSGLTTTPLAYLKVKVKDLKTNRPLMATVKLEPQPNKAGKFKTQKTGETGESMFCLDLNRSYVLSISEPGYMFFSNNLKQVERNSIDKPNVLDINLQPIETGAEVQLYNIYFETDSFRILPQSEPELQYLTSFLKNNVGLKVEIQGHTDSSGSSDRNLALSIQRANAVVEYLIKAGIPKNRLKAEGYGDSKPVADNITLEGRSKNRRTTVKIVGNQ